MDLLLNGVNRLIEVCEFTLEWKDQRTQSQYFKVKGSDDEDGEAGEISQGKKFIWLRATLPLHCALALIELLICQPLRCVASFAIGVLTFRASYIYDAFNDLISIPIQLIALPVITLLGCVNPQDGLKALKTFKRMAGGQLKEMETKGTRFAFYRAVTGFVRGLFGVPITIITQTTRLFSLLLIADLNKTSEKIKTLFTYLVSSILLPFLGCITIWSKRAMLHIHKVQQINFTMMDYLG